MASHHDTTNSSSAAALNSRLLGKKCQRRSSTAAICKRGSCTHISDPTAADDSHSKRLFGHPQGGRRPRRRGGRRRQSVERSLGKNKRRAACGHQGQHSRRLHHGRRPQTRPTESCCVGVEKKRSAQQGEECAVQCDPARVGLYFQHRRLVMSCLLRQWKFPSGPPSSRLLCTQRGVYFFFFSSSEQRGGYL